MFQIPDISRMNSESETNVRMHEQAIRTGKLRGKRIECEMCGEKAFLIRPYYDIYSPLIRGVFGLCPEHESELPDSMFECSSCQRIVLERYSWEPHYVHDAETGEALCLGCHAERELANSVNWVPLTDERIAQVDFAFLRRLPHLLAVRQPVPDCIRFVANVEVDASCGGRLTSFSTCEPNPEGAVEEMKAILRRLKADGYTKAFLMIDSVWQFALSLGAYASAEEAQRLEAGEERAA